MLVFQKLKCGILYLMLIKACRLIWKKILQPYAVGISSLEDSAL